MEATILKILILEDVETDAAIIQRVLIKAGSQYEFEVVFEKAAYTRALQNFKPDVVLSDNSMPRFSAAEALQILQQQKTLIPFILVTGAVSEEFAAGIIKAGADDYLLKDRLARLPVAIEAAVKQKKADREKLEAIEQLKQSEEKYREIVENITDIICTHTIDGKIVSTNLAAEKNLGYQISELLEMNIRDLLSPSYRDSFSDYINAIEQNGFVKGLMQVQTKAGEKRIWEYKNTLSSSLDGIKQILGFAQDVTERLEAERMLSQNEKRFRALVENNEGIISMLDKNMKTIFRSASAARITGWSNKEFEKIDNYEYVHPDDLNKTIDTFALALDNPGIAFPQILRVKHKDGNYIWLEGVINNLLDEKAIGGIISNFRNITKRKNAEIKLIKANRLYALISQVNQMIVRISDHETIFKEVCKIAIDFGKFKMAWIGITDIVTNSVTALVHAGEENGYLAQIKLISTNDIPEGRGPTGSAVRTGKITVCNDIENDPQMAPWKKEAISRGYRSLISLPIKKFGNVIGAFTLYAGEKNFFDAEEIGLLEEATGDVSFTLELFEKEEFRKKAEERILESERSYHTLSEISPTGIFRTDINGSTKYVNSMWCKITGLSVEEGMRNGWQKGLHEEDKKSLIEGWENALVSNANTTLEYRVVRPDGSLVWVIGQVTPERNFDNQIIGYVGTIMDITERKKAEDKIRKANDRFDMIARATNDAVFEYNLVTGESWHNESFLALFGSSYLNSQNGPNIERWKEKIHPDDKLRVLNKLKKAYDGTDATWSDEFRFKKADDCYGIFFDRAVIVRDNSGGAVSFVGSMIEITQLKAAQEKLLAQKVQLETLSNNLPGVMIYQLVKEANGESNFTYVSSGVFELTGKTQEEVIEKPSILYDLIHPEDLPKFMETESESSRNMSVFKIEVRCINHKGETRWLNIVSTPRKLGDGRTVWDGFHLDTTERKKADAAIVESEEKYRVLVAEASEGIFISDSDGRFVTVNASASRLSQYTEQELLQMSIYDFLTQDDMQEKPLQFDAIREGKTVVVERVMKLKDGSLNHLEITSKLLTDGRLLSLVRDVAERKKAEAAILLSNERYNLVSKATNDAIWDFNILTGVTTRTGDGFKNLFGYENESANEAELHWTKLIHPDDLVNVTTSEQAIFNNPEEHYWEQEYRFLKKDGNYAFVYDKGYIIRDAAGKAIRMIGAMQDITRQKENESHLIKLNESLLAKSYELANSNAELEQFAYVASHDMQEPLRMVTSFLLLFEKKYKTGIDETGKKYIHFAVDGAKRMRQIILDLLDFSRVGQNYIEPKELDLTELIQDIQSLYRKEIEEKKAVISTGELPLIIASESPIRQVFQNLISNALKYGRDETPVRISIQAIDFDDHWQFSVVDNGIGISKEYYEKIFVIFQRLHNLEKFSGTGIGLAVTKKIIEKLGGKIWVQSDEGEGSTFYFTIKKIPTALK